MDGCSNAIGESRLQCFATVSDRCADKGLNRTRRRIFLQFNLHVGEPVHVFFLLDVTAILFKGIVARPAVVEGIHRDRVHLAAKPGRNAVANAVAIGIKNGCAIQGRHIGVRELVFAGERIFQDKLVIVQAVRESVHRESRTVTDSLGRNHHELALAVLDIQADRSVGQFQVLAAFAQEHHRFALSFCRNVKGPLKSRVNAALRTADRDDGLDIDMHRIAHLVGHLRLAGNFLALDIVLQVRDIEIVDEAHLRVRTRRIIRRTQREIVQLVAASDSDIHETGFVISLYRHKVLEDSLFLRKFRVSQFKRQRITAQAFFIRGIHVKRCPLDCSRLVKRIFSGRNHPQLRTAVIPNTVILAQVLIFVGNRFVVRTVRIIQRKNSCRKTQHRQQNQRKKICLDSQHYDLGKKQNTRKKKFA